MVIFAHSQVCLADIAEKYDLG